MTLREYLQSNSLFKNTLANDVKTFYGLDNAPAWLADKYLTQYTNTLKLKQGSREMYYTDEEDVQLITNLMFITNHDKYKHLDDLFKLEYNPIWNVDGVTTTERSGTEGRDTSNTFTDTTTYNTTVAKTGTEALAISESDTHTGTDTTTYNTTEGLTDTNSETTYDSATFYDTDKKVDSNTKTGTEALGYNSTQAKTGSDTTTYNTSDTHTGSDTLGHQGTGSEDIERSESETITRQGNQGITTTQSMALEEINYSNYIKLIEIIALDIVREITYAV